MESSIIYNYKKFRYLSNPKSLLQSLLFFTSSQTKTLIPNPSSAFSATKNPSTNSFNNNGDSRLHLICRNSCLNPSLNCSISSFRSVSTSSITIFSSQEITHGQHPSFKFYSLCPVYIFFRSLSISTNKSSSGKSAGIFVSRGKTDFGESIRDANYKFRLSRRRDNKLKVVKAPEVEKEKITEIIELIKKEEHDIEAKLDQTSVNLTHASVREIFRVLNCDGVSGLKFFGWVRGTKIDFSRNSDFCSLIIDNLGRLEDYESMLLLLKDFSSKGLCLTENAFAFLPVSSSDGFVVVSYVKRTIDTLKMAGGSSRGSGIHALIKKLCTLNSFDLAIFVMEETTRKTSYYNVLIWAKCGGSLFQEAQELFDEMKRFDCDPNANSYNYLLGSLCKTGRISEACHLLEVMENSGYLPDGITFEVIIHHAAKLGRLDFAFEFLNQMMSRGMEPRMTTHAAFIKGFFNCDRFQEAYKYVVDMSLKYKCSGNMNYSLLANLHRQQGKLIEAREILVDMIEKGLKPNFSVYIKVMKDLHKSGMGPLVGDLKSRFSKFHPTAKVQ